MIIFLASILLAVALLVLAWKRRATPKPIPPHLYFVTGVLLVSSLSDAVSLPRAAKVAAFVIQWILVAAIFWSAVRLKGR